MIIVDNNHNKLKSISKQKKIKLTEQEEILESTSKIIKIYPVKKDLKESSHFHHSKNINKT